MNKSTIRGIEPVLSSSDVKRDIKWLEEHMGFEYAFGDEMYAGAKREEQYIHVQWHKGDESDPVTPSTIKIFVHDLEPFIEEFVERGTITADQVRRDTPWGTHEFGFYDLNRNAIFIVQDK